MIGKKPVYMVIDVAKIPCIPSFMSIIIERSFRSGSDKKSLVSNQTVQVHGRIYLDHDTITSLQKAFCTNELTIKSE